MEVSFKMKIEISWRPRPRVFYLLVIRKTKSRTFFEKTSSIFEWLDVSVKKKLPKEIRYFHCLSSYNFILVYFFLESWLEWMPRKYIWEDKSIVSIEMFLENCCLPKKSYNWRNVCVLMACYFFLIMLRLSENLCAIRRLFWQKCDQFQVWKVSIIFGLDLLRDCEIKLEFCSVFGRLLLPDWGHCRVCWVDSTVLFVIIKILHISWGVLGQ